MLGPKGGTPIYLMNIYQATIARSARSIALIRLGYESETRMVDQSKSVPFCSRNNEAIFFQVDSSILTLDRPDVEEIAKAIWQRQHDTLVSSSLFYNATWRDQSIPSKFWDEFLLDAHAVLSLLYKKHIEYQNTRERFIAPTKSA